MVQKAAGLAVRTMYERSRSRSTCATPSNSALKLPLQGFGCVMGCQKHRTAMSGEDLLIMNEDHESRLAVEILPVFKVSRKGRREAKKKGAQRTSTEPDS